LMVTEDEAAALSLPPMLLPLALASGHDEGADDEMGPADETASKSLGDWRTIRRKTARTRVPPPKPRRLSA